MFGFTTIQTMGAMNRSMDVSFGDALTVMEYDLGMECLKHGGSIATNCCGDIAQDVIM